MRFAALQYHGVARLCRRTSLAVGLALAFVEIHKQLAFLLAPGKVFEGSSLLGLASSVTPLLVGQKLYRFTQCILVAP